MSFIHQRSIFWFRQDLRLEDNHGLTKAINESKSILPIFIFDSDILALGPANDQRLLFLSDSVRHLQEQLRSIGSNLVVLHGKPAEHIPQLIKQHNIQAVYANTSYGYGSKTRDKAIQLSCSALGVPVHFVKDFLLVEPQEIDVRKVFTPYSKLWYRFLENNLPHILPAPSHIPTIEHTLQHSSVTVQGSHPYWPVATSTQLLQSLQLNQYEEQRNTPSLAGTSKLSPYIRFGLVSIRMLFQEVKNNIVFTNELARREFWQHIAYYFPETRTLEFQEKRRKIKRSYNQELFQKWCRGETGYPIVDAGMRQLQQENRMHGRVRMIVASFLTKDLLIDRRLGEKHFAQYLLDYDTNVNIGNRQRSASVGADPKPLRIFNPILQSQKFDPQAEYILKYLPELKGQDLQAIHDPLIHKLNYHPPIVDHYTNSKLAREAYKLSNP